jgi:hypothetical protein
MTRIEQLTALRDAVRDGVWPGWADTPMGWDTNLLWKAFNGSVDAALALFAALLPGATWNLWMSGNEFGCNTDDVSETAYAPDPARALLLAVLEALIAKEEGR